jgi:hypothetical protein
MLHSIADLVAFLKWFHRGWAQEPGLDPSLIQDDLPPGLASIYWNLGALVAIEPGPKNDWRAPFATQDELVPVTRLKRVDGMVEFAWENQGNWSARCPVRESDPPVYSNAPEVGEPEREGFVVVCPSLNHFLTTLCLQEAVMGCRNLAAFRTAHPASEAVAGELQPLWLRGHYVFEEPTHDFFVSPDQDLLVMQHRHTGAWIGSPVRSVGDLIQRGCDARIMSGA